MKAIGFCTHSEGFFSWVTARVTRRDDRPLVSVATHVGIAFILDAPIPVLDGGTASEVYCDGIRGGGVMGWKSIGKLNIWNSKHGARRVWMYDLYRTEDQAVAMFQFCRESFGRYKYSERQLAQIYLMHRLGRPVKMDDNEIVCSDFAAMACAAGGLDVRAACGLPSTDAVSPADCQVVFEQRSG